MEVQKSSRHSKIAGDFGERLVLYLLSKYNCECAFIDHVGIDIIARNTVNQELMGISVKTRTRNNGAEGTALNIQNKELLKVKSACEAFGCKPYFSLVIDQEDKIYIFILSQDKLLELFPQGQRVVSIKTTKIWIKKFEEDSDVISFVFENELKTWW